MQSLPHILLVFSITQVRSPRAHLIHSPFPPLVQITTWFTSCLHRLMKILNLRYAIIKVEVASNSNIRSIPEFIVCFIENPVRIQNIWIIGLKLLTWIWIRNYIYWGEDWLSGKAAQRMHGGLHVENKAWEIFWVMISLFY